MDRTLYPNTHIIEIAPKNLDETVLTGTLNLEEEAKKNRIKEGYNDTKLLLKPIMLMAKFQKEKEEEEKHPTLYKTYKWIKNFLNKESQRKC